MKTESSSVTKLKISEIDRLDDIAVFLEDLGPRQGKITIECYGKSWSAFWGVLGYWSIAEFFVNCNSEYIISNLSQGIQPTVRNYDDLDKWFYRGIISARREGSISSDRAREIWDEIPWKIDDSEHCLHGEDVAGMAYEVFSDEWWCLIPESPNGDYEYLERIVLAVQKALIAIGGES